MPNQSILWIEIYLSYRSHFYWNAHSSISLSTKFRLFSNAKSDFQTAFAKIYSNVTTKVSKIISLQTPSYFPLSMKSRQRIIDDINFLVYRTSLHFADIDSHKKLDFVLIPISMSWSIFLSHVRCIRKREFYISCVMKQQHPEKLLHLYGSQWITQVLDSINMPLCNNV